METVPSDVEELSRGVFRRLLGREEAEVRRIWDVVGLVRAGRCQTGVLLERFGGPGGGAGAMRALRVVPPRGESSPGRSVVPQCAPPGND